MVSSWEKPLSFVILNLIFLVIGTQIKLRIRKEIEPEIKMMKTIVQGKITTEFHDALVLAISDVSEEEGVAPTTRCSARTAHRDFIV